MRVWEVLQFILFIRCVSLGFVLGSLFGVVTGLVLGFLLGVLLGLGFGRRREGDDLSDQTELEVVKFFLLRLDVLDKDNGVVVGKQLLLRVQVRLEPFRGLLHGGIDLFDGGGKDGLVFSRQVVGHGGVVELDAVERRAQSLQGSRAFLGLAQADDDGILQFPTF